MVYNLKRSQLLWRVTSQRSHSVLCWFRRIPRFAAFWRNICGLVKNSISDSDFYIFSKFQTGWFPVPGLTRAQFLQFMNKTECNFFCNPTHFFSATSSTLTWPPRWCGDVWSQTWRPTPPSGKSPPSSLPSGRTANKSVSSGKALLTVWLSCTFCCILWTKVTSCWHLACCLVKTLWWFAHQKPP